MRISSAASSWILAVAVAVLGIVVPIHTSEADKRLEGLLWGLFVFLLLLAFYGGLADWFRDRRTDLLAVSVARERDTKFIHVKVSIRGLLRDSVRVSVVRMEPGPTELQEHGDVFTDKTPTLGWYLPWRNDGTRRERAWEIDRGTPQQANLAKDEDDQFRLYSTTLGEGWLVFGEPLALDLRVQTDHSGAWVVRVSMSHGEEPQVRVIKRLAPCAFLRLNQTS